MAKAPTPGKNKAHEREEAPTFTIIVAGERHPVWFGEVTALDTGDMRRALGYGLTRLQQDLANGELDLDTVAALVWLSRRQCGESRLEYGTVAAALNYTTTFEVEVADPDTDETEDEDAPNS